MTASRLPIVMNRIDGRLNCDVGLETDGELVPPGPVVDVVGDAEVAEGGASADVSVTLTDAGSASAVGIVVPDRLDLTGQGLHLALGRGSLAKALRGRELRHGAVTVRAGRGRGFYTLRVTGVRGAHLTVRSRAKASGRSPVRVRTQFAFSRHRR